MSNFRAHYVVTSMVRRAYPVGLFVAGVLCLSSLGLSQDSTSDKADLVPVKRPFPSATQQADARRTIRDLFKKEFDQAKNAKGKLALAETLLSRAAELEEDHNGLYAILSEAAENAAAAGELSLATKAIDQVQEHFGTPPLELQEKVAKIIIPIAKTQPQILQVLELELALIREAVAADDMDTAQHVLPTAQALSRKLGSSGVKDQLLALSKEISAMASAYESAADAKTKLGAMPDDQNANLVWGKYLCFAKGDWANGLPLLIKSQDPVLAPLAQRDLDQPTDAAANVALGDDWRNLSEKEKEPIRSIISARAIEPYTRALSVQSGIQGTSTETKLAQLFGASQLFTSVASEAKFPVIADASLNFEAVGTVECWVQTQANQGPLFSKRTLEPEGTLGVRLYNGKACLFENASWHYREVQTTVLINDGRWHHLAITKSGKEATLFIDGVLIASLAIQSKLTSKSPWRAGTSYDVGPPASLRLCKFRYSNIVRYLVTFKPEYNLKKDKATLFLSGAK